MPESPTFRPRNAEPGSLLAVLSLAAALLFAGAAPAQQQIGPVSGLALPRFVSLKSDRVNLHEGPSKEHPTLWVYERDRKSVV